MEKNIILDYIKAHPGTSSRHITEAMNGQASLATVKRDSIDYKKAMLLFYEQNNISAFKRIFIEQFRFAVETYF